MTVRYLPFTFTLRAPAILNVLGGDPNSAATMSFIPGGAIRGAFAARLGDPDSRAEIRSQFQTFVLDGSVRCLHAYPLDDGKRRTLPAPTSLRSPREADRHLDLAAFEGQDQATWPEGSLSIFPWQYVSFTSAQPAGISAEIGCRIHHQRDRQRGRAWKEKRDGRELPHGAIFTYEYLEPSQAFGGLIQVHGGDEAECEDRIERIQRILTGQIHLGRSRRAGYGGEAEVVWGSVRKREISGEGVISRDLQAGELFRVLLTSDCVVRDPRSGQIDPAALPELFVARLGGRATLQRIRWAFDLTGGFNQKWRLELPQARTVAAGSVLLFKAEDNIPIDDLLAMEHEGIGERLTEGYGRLVFLEAPVQEIRIRSCAQAPVTKPSAPASEVVTFIERRLLRAAMNLEIERLALTVASRASRIPTASLLGRLRVPLRAQPGPALQTLAEWLGFGARALRRPAQDQLRRCRIDPGTGRVSLLAWLSNLVSEHRWDRLKELLSLESLAQRNHVVSEAGALRQLERMNDEIAVRVIDATLAALAKQRKRKEASAT
jgi:CRISPR-associated protein Csx10